VWRGGNGAARGGPTPPSGRGVDWCALIACLLEQRGVRAWLEKQGLDADAIARCWKDQCGDDASVRALLASPAIADLVARFRHG
jgi:hypothetical protein